MTKLIEKYDIRRKLELDLQSINREINDEIEQSLITHLELNVNEVFEIDGKKLQIQGFNLGGCPHRLLLSVKEV